MFLGEDPLKPAVHRCLRNAAPCSHSLLHGTTRCSSPRRGCMEVSRLRPRKWLDIPLAQDAALCRVVGVHRRQLLAKIVLTCPGRDPHGQLCAKLPDTGFFRGSLQCHRCSTARNPHQGRARGTQVALEWTKLNKTPFLSDIFSEADQLPLTSLPLIIKARRTDSASSCTAKVTYTA